MCGIAGIVGNDVSACTPRLESAVSQRVHRGPDDRGLWADQHAALAFCRLAILDLSQAGHQPMLDQAMGTDDSLEAPL